LKDDEIKINMITHKISRCHRLVVRENRPSPSDSFWTFCFERLLEKMGRNLKEFGWHSEWRPAVEKLLANSPRLHTLSLGMGQTYNPPWQWNSPNPHPSLKTLLYDDYFQNYSNLPKMLLQMPNLESLGLRGRGPRVNSGTRWLYTWKPDTKLLHLEGTLLLMARPLQHLRTLNLLVTNHADLLRLIGTLPLLNKIESLKLWLNAGLCWPIRNDPQRDSVTMEFLLLLQAIETRDTLRELEFKPPVVRDRIPGEFLIKKYLISLPLSIESIKYNDIVIRAPIHH
jgi:hypothetical protein